MRPLDMPFVFVIGAPRSGTSWLHQMLGSHPDVAAMEKEELTVFTRYIGPWVHNYDIEDRAQNIDGIRQGLPCLFTEEELYDLMGGLVDRVYARLLERRNPEGTVILDKHPNYCNQLALIDRLVPHSRFIHIIRDGREVAVSMNSAFRRLGFGAGDTRGAAIDWHKHITNARAYAPKLGDRYTEVRYEDLRSRTGPELERLMAFSGLRPDTALVERLVREHDISVRQVSTGDTTLNALRDTPDAIWRNKLSTRQRFTFDHIAGGLLQRLGYAQAGWWALSPTDRLRMWPYGVSVKAKRSMDALKEVWKNPFEPRLG